MSDYRMRADPDGYDFEAAPRRRRGAGLIERTIDGAMRNPVVAGGAMVAGIAMLFIVTNALANQSVRHPSPLFNTRMTGTIGPKTVATLPLVSGSDPLQPLASAEAPAQVPQTPAQTQSASLSQQQIPVPVTAVTPKETLADDPATNVAVPPLANLQVQTTQHIQQALRDRGFYTGAVDGIAGPATAEAIRAFEQRVGVPASGEADDKVLALLKSPRGRVVNQHPQVAAARPVAQPVPVAVVAPPARPAVQLMPAPVPPEPLTGSTEGRLQKAQRALNVAGYGPIRTDGIQDEKTSEAIRKFEAEHGLPQTGRMSDRLLSALVVRSADAR